MAAAQPAGFGKAPVQRKTVKPVKDVEVPDGWKLVGNVADFFIDSKGQERQVKAWEVGRLQMAIYHVKEKGKVFASDALSTAFKFPLIDAKLVEVDGKTCIESESRISPTAWRSIPDPYSSADSALRWHSL